ncbi:MAG: putative baseplate assembly protein, partial [Acidimicrobiia bacterium]
GAEDRHFVMNPVTGEIEFGPSVRDPSGRVRQYGAIAPKGAPIRIRSYLSGGGHEGNVARRAISILTASIPFISSVENRHAAGGGVDGEELDSAKIRGPIVFRTRNRAVTLEDYAYLAREAAPEVARVECVPAGDGADAGAVRVLVVPTAPDDEIGRMHFEDLVPSPEILEKISRHLDERRTIGARVIVEPPEYQGITVVARLRPRPRANPQRLQRDALEALYRYFNPITGGAEGDGWPFGRPLHIGEIYSVFQRLRGIEFVEDARLFAADPITGSRGESVQSLDIGSHALVFSYEHQVMVEGS